MIELELLKDKNVFIMPTGALQQDFEYIFTEIPLSGYIDENVTESYYNKRPIVKLKNVLLKTESFIIICEKKSGKRKKQLENEGCLYKANFCFMEDLFECLDYDLQKMAAGREIVICDDKIGDLEYIYPEMLLDGCKYGSVMHGMKIQNPKEFKEWKDCLVIVTVDNPGNIYEVLNGKGLRKGEDYIWYKDVKSMPVNKRILYYGCGNVAQRLFNMLDRHIARNISLDKLGKCNKENQYVIIKGTVYEKIPVLERLEYTEIRDYVHWNYMQKMEKRKPSDLLRQVMYAPKVEQPRCNLPFEEACIVASGEVYGCICPGWNAISFGNITYESCQNVWNSIYAKIFRLSIIDKAYCFCKENYCYQMTFSNPLINDKEDRENYNDYLSPRIIKFNTDRSCNLFCMSCRESRTVLQGDDLENARFINKRLVDSDWIKNAECLNIAGNGEVFYSDIYKEILYDIPNGAHMIQVFSNGNLFTAKEFERIRTVYEVIEVEISLDAASQKTYEKLRRGGNWNVLMNNLKYLMKKRLENQLSKFTINMIVQKENYEEIPAFIKMGKELHADIIAIRPLMNWGTYSEEEYRNTSMISHEKNWISDELKTVLNNPLLEEKEVDYTWFKKRM